MGKPDPTNPSTEPQDDKKQSGTDPIVKHQNPGQQGQGRDPSKDQGRQKSGGDQQGGKDPAQGLALRAASNKHRSHSIPVHSWRRSMAA
jgi:hypothetical protein